LLLAQHLPHHGVDAAHGVLRGIERARVLAQEGLDGRSQKSGAHAMAADIGHEIPEDAGIQWQDVVKIAAGFLERMKVDREGGRGALPGLDQNRLLGMAELLQVRLVLASKRPVSRIRRCTRTRARTSSPCTGLAI